MVWYIGQKQRQAKGSKEGKKVKEGILLATRRHRVAK
jgi:hypothetical protein